MNDDDLKRLFEETRGHFDEKAAETQRHFDEKAAETQHHFDEKAAETQRHFDEKAAETQRHFDEKAAETQRHFDVSTEAFRHEVRLLAESVDLRFDRLTERIDNLEERMDRGFADTQGMIKFSHAELDRRVRALEQALGELQARVERPGTTTH